MKQLRKHGKDAISKRQKHARGEMCFYFHHKKRDTMWCNKKEIQDESKRFRQLVKKGVLTMEEGNNTTVEIDGKTYYIFVVQHKDEESNNIDPLAAGYGFFVSGWVYFFTQEYNRDVLFKYIMNKK